MLQLLLMQTCYCGTGELLPSSETLTLLPWTHIVLKLLQPAYQQWHSSISWQPTQLHDSPSAAVQQQPLPLLHTGWNNLAVGPADPTHVFKTAM